MLVGLRFLGGRAAPRGVPAAAHPNWATAEGSAPRGATTELSRHLLPVRRILKILRRRYRTLYISFIPWHPRPLPCAAHDLFMSTSLRLTRTQADAFPVALRTAYGSEVHGTALPGAAADHDHMGIAFESASMALGIEPTPAQWSFRDAHNRPGDDPAYPEGNPAREPRSQANDLEYVIYPARKWVLLATCGNPTAVVPSSAPYRGVARGGPPRRYDVGAVTV